MHGYISIYVCVRMFVCLTITIGHSKKDSVLILIQSVELKVKDKKGVNANNACLRGILFCLQISIATVQIHE